MIGPMAYLGKEDNFRQFCYNYDIQQFGIFFDNPSSKADKVQLFIFFYSVTIAKQARKQASFFPVAVTVCFSKFNETWGASIWHMKRVQNIDTFKF